jgi:hypothetical protein
MALLEALEAVDEASDPPVELDTTLEVVKVVEPVVVVKVEEPLTPVDTRAEVTVALVAEPEMVVTPVTVVTSVPLVMTEV